MKYDACMCIDTTLGYRLLDGAAAYGNETEVGEAIAEALGTGIVKREELVRMHRQMYSIGVRIRRICVFCDPHKHTFTRSLQRCY